MFAQRYHRHRNFVLSRTIFFNSFGCYRDWGEGFTGFTACSLNWKFHCFRLTLTREGNRNKVATSSNWHSAICRLKWFVTSPTGIQVIDIKPFYALPIDACRNCFSLFCTEKINRFARRADPSHRKNNWIETCEENLNCFRSKSARTGNARWSVNIALNVETLSALTADLRLQNCWIISLCNSFAMAEWSMLSNPLSIVAATSF